MTHNSLPYLAMLCGCVHAASVLACGVIGHYNSVKQLGLDLIPGYGLYRSVLRGLTGQ